MIPCNLKSKLKKYLIKKEIGALEDVYKRQEVEDYFFSTKNELKWFYPLKILGYFNPKNAPLPIPTGQGYFSIPHWNVLPYLEKVSGQVGIPDNAEYIDELLEIILNVSNYKNVKKQHIDNNHIWWYCVKILLNIPNEKISSDIIKLIPAWLTSKFDTSLAGSDIVRKLLPKFLPENPTKEDIQKAEQIIDYITVVKSIPLDRQRAKLLGKDQEKRFIIDDYWLRLAFEKYSVSIGEKCTNKVTESLAKRTKNLLKKQESIAFLEENNEQYMLVLTEKSSKYIIKIKGMKEKYKIGDFAELISGKTPNAKQLKRLAINKCNMNSFMDVVYPKLRELNWFKKMDEYELKKSINSLYCDFYNSETYKSFYEESKHTISGPIELFTFILKRILIARSKNNVQETRKILRGFLGDNYLYFPKMALYVIGQNTGRYSNLFWEWLGNKTANFIIGSIYWGDELKHVLRNLKNINSNQREMLKTRIDDMPKYYSSKEDPKRYEALLKQEFYQALIGDPDFKQLYDKMKEITKKDAELQPAMTIGQSWSGPGPSPLTKEAIFKKTNSEIAQFLLNFKSANRWANKPTRRGLSEMLTVAAKEQPQKFIKNLSPFMASDYLYIYYILQGITNAWKEKKPIQWGKLFSFIKQYIDRDEFWQDKFKMATGEKFWDATHEWVIGAITELICEGTKVDDWAFDEKYLLSAQEIILLIINHLKIEEREKVNDPVDHALNSSWGKVINALILLSLRIARVKNKKKKNKWSKNLKDGYLKALKNKINEAYALFGRHIPNLLYLDENLVKRKIEEFRKIQGGSLWSAFMIGYLSGNVVYNNLYKLMEKHYIKALTYSFEGKHTEERLVQHVGIGYLRGLEDLSGKGLFGRILKKWDYEQIEELISFFWMQRDYSVKSIDKDISVPLSPENDKIKNRILDFWEYLYKKYKNKSSLKKKDKEMLSKVSRLTIFLPEISNKNIKLLMLSAAQIHLGFNYAFFIEYLNDLKDKGDVQSGRYVGEIFLRLLDDFMPDHDQNHIKAIIEYLYKADDPTSNRLAKQICNIYIRNGKYFVKDIHEKYNK